MNTLPNEPAPTRRTTTGVRWRWDEMRWEDTGSTRNEEVFFSHSDSSNHNSPFRATNRIRESVDDTFNTYSTTTTRVDAQCEANEWRIEISESYRKFIWEFSLSIAFRHFCIDLHFSSPRSTSDHRRILTRSFLFTSNCESGLAQLVSALSSCPRGRETILGMHSSTTTTVNNTFLYSSPLRIDSSYSVLTSFSNVCITVCVTTATYRLDRVCICTILVGGIDSILDERVDWWWHFHLLLTSRCSILLLLLLNTWT